MGKSQGHRPNTHFRKALRSHKLRCLTPVLRTLNRDIITPNVWTIVGTDQSSGDCLSIIYFGTEVNKNYISHVLFAGNCQETFIGRYYFWSIPYILRKTCLNCSLIVIETNYLLRRIYQDKGDFYVPLWLSGEADIPLVASNESAKSDLRKIHNNNLGFIVTHELSQFHNFYHNMYLPYVKQRYQYTTIIMDYEHMMQWANDERFELLLVEKGGAFIAGMVLAFDKDIPRLRRMGIKDANRSYLEDGAGAALYYFSSVYLKERGYQSMNTGFSRAFLRDGVLQYKKKWGVRVAGYSYRGFLLKPVSLSPGVRGLLHRNPFVYVDKGRLWAAVFVENYPQLSKKNLERLQKEWSLAGLSGLFIYGCGEGEDQLDRTWTTMFRNDGLVVKG